MNKCIDCGKYISEKAKRCKICHNSSHEFTLKLIDAQKHAQKKRLKTIREKNEIKQRQRQLSVDVSYEKKNPVDRARGRVIVANKGKYNSSKLENKIIDIINGLNIKCKQSYMPIEINYIFDAYLPNNNILVEIDGEYWHKMARAIKSDAKKSALAKAAGYKLLRFKEEKLPKNEAGLIKYVANRLSRAGVKINGV